MPDGSKIQPSSVAVERNRIPEPELKVKAKLKTESCSSFRPGQSQSETGPSDRGSEFLSCHDRI